MTLLQLEASAQAPCSSTITGLAGLPALTVAVLADAPAGVAPGAITIKAAARTAAGSAGRPMRRALRLSDMSVSSLGCVLGVLRAGARALAPQGLAPMRSIRRSWVTPRSASTCQKTWRSTGYGMARIRH